MSGKIPNLKKLRSVIEDSKNLSQKSISYDFEESLRKKASEEDDLVFSSESETNLSKFFHLTRQKSALTCRGGKNNRILQLEKEVSSQKNQINDLKFQLEKILTVEQQRNKLSNRNSYTKEKQLIGKLKEYKDQIIELKRSNFSLSQANKLLTEKVKILENLNDKGTRHSVTRQYSHDSRNLQGILEDASNKLEVLKDKYACLVENSHIFEEKTKELYNVNQMLHKNLVNLSPSLL